jgi:hypothetical protein
MASALGQGISPVKTPSEEVQKWGRGLDKRSGVMMVAMIMVTIIIYFRDVKNFELNRHKQYNKPYNQ